MKKVLLLHFLFLHVVLGLSQVAGTKGAAVQNTNQATEPEDTGTIYALIVGVSKYEDPAMPQLQYADSDAVYFAMFLRSGAMGTVDSINIKLLTNQNATDNNIKKERAWILRRLKPGDRVYIYLSGHGDAINPEAIYFLSHNTPKVSDKEEYTAVSGINLLEMQTVVKMFIEKQAKVFFISDFCRTNELVGKDNSSRFLYSSVMEQQIPGLTKMVSCTADEVSFEDKKWGNGRGVFSFHLINGLLGLADNPTTPDGKVTLYELENYVKRNVGEDTKSPTTGEPRQTPEFKGDKQVLCRVNEKVKEQLIAHKNNNSDYLAMVTKSALADAAVDTALFAAFVAAIGDERLIEPEKNNARYYLDQLLKVTKSKLQQDDLTDMFIAACLDKGQKPIDYYSKGLLERVKYTQIDFLNAADCFRAAALYLQQNATLLRKSEASRLFLKARAMKDSYKEADWRKGLIYADSSLMLMNWPYTYHTKAMLFTQLEEMDSALKYERLAFELAPQWSFSANMMGVIFTNMQQYDSAEIYYRKSIASNPRYEDAINNLGANFNYKRQYDSADLYYRKAILLNPFEEKFYINRICNFIDWKKYNLALDHYLKLIELKPPQEEKYRKDLAKFKSYLGEKDAEAKAILQPQKSNRPVYYNTNPMYYYYGW
ncbi:MAG: caspase family protein [Chitinophagales bacterium]|nr:caspase family protein [Chitinophagales bacterium]